MFSVTRRSFVEMAFALGASAAWGSSLGRAHCASRQPPPPNTLCLRQLPERKQGAQNAYRRHFCPRAGRSLRAPVSQRSSTPPVISCARTHGPQASTDGQHAAASGSTFLPGVRAKRRHHQGTCAYQSRPVATPEIRRYGGTAMRW